VGPVGPVADILTVPYILFVNDNAFADALNDNEVMSFGFAGSENVSVLFGDMYNDLNGISGVPSEREFDVGTILPPKYTFDDTCKLFCTFTLP
jgi:hypothetical protein